MGRLNHIKRWRGELTSEEAVAKVQAVCAEAPWGWVFPRRKVTSRTWRTWVVNLAADDDPGGPWVHVDARQGRIRRVEHKPPADRRVRLAAGGLVVVLLVLITVLYFLSPVCGDDVLSTGRVVVACRHLQATDPPIIAIGIVILAAFGVFYTEISGFGITLKRKIDEVDWNARAGLQLAERNQKEAKRVDETMDDLAEYNAERNRKEVKGSQGYMPEDTNTVHASDVSKFESEGQPPVDTSMRDLASQYNTLRGTMASGDRRTEQMTQTVQEMRVLLKGAEGFDLAGYLASDDRGMRLAAYAYLMEHPAPQSRQQLIDAAIREDKPFGQYWALRAIRQQLTATVDPLRNEDLAKLTGLAQRLGAGTDRAREIQAILELIRSGQ